MKVYLAEVGPYDDVIEFTGVFSKEEIADAWVDDVRKAHPKNTSYSWVTELVVDHPIEVKK
jgi:hypothetical protein